MPGSFRIAYLLGIPLLVNISWFVIFAVVTLSLVLGQLPAQFPLWPPVAYVVVGVATSLLFFASVIVHELAHSLVARVIGVPVRSITLFIFGGVAQIGRDASRPAGELVMAAAGPLSSLALAALFAVVWAVSRPFHEPTMALAGWLAWINLSLGLFNLVPGFPMDGGRVLRSLLWWATGSHRTATRIAVAVGHLVAYLFMLGGLAVIFGGQYNMLNGLWMVFVGWFLKQAASGSSRQARVRESLQGYTARNLMTTDPLWVSEDTTVQQLVDGSLAATGRSWSLVVCGAYLRGLLTVSDLRKVPQRRWSLTRVDEVMTPIQTLGTVSPDIDAHEALEEMEDRNAAHLPVVEDGRLLGVVTQTGLLRAARVRRALGF